MKQTALIMAGGYGKGFWPLSRKSMPKQFLSLTKDGKTMIQQTVERILPMLNIEDIYISASEEYKELVRAQIPGIPERNIICEPAERGTAAAIGYCAMKMREKYGDTIMMVFPSDLLIKYTAMFQRNLAESCDIALQGENLVTIGITPYYPETEYGYIRFDSDRHCKRAVSVKEFIEKPSLEQAKRYLSSEEYLWNSGIFVWKTSSILKQIQNFEPNLYQGLVRIENNRTDQEFIQMEYRKFDKASVECAIMEKAKDIYLLPGTFGWDDIGSWLAMDRIQIGNELGNVTKGDIVAINTHDCIVCGEKKLLALVGLENMVIVDSEDALLISEKDSIDEVKQVLDQMTVKGMEQYL